MDAFVGVLSVGVGVGGSTSGTCSRSGRRRLVVASAGKDGYKLNISEAIMVDLEGESLNSISKMPISAIQGVGEKTEKVLGALGLKTVSDMADYKFYKISRAIAVLESVERDGKRPDSSTMNIDKAVDKDFESKSFGDICDASASALQGISEEKGELLASIGVDTVRKLGEWKYFKWAESIVDLSKFEETK
ncbi:hypothetical protein NDN08_003883 [Rhodosorus marinus]|uniref:UmuC domain-containing protein n=1 Tax=Rhodosorus marinus TaxID=101924 RepID=A0AAV8UK86_9RHOD|nr:hypothetical protein NDN08_003883 [Rhodosorus marinus]